MAEHPMTWEMYDAVMGVKTPATEPHLTQPKAPANVRCANFQELCRGLSEQSGRNDRLPTATEWDYAARVETSNSPFAEEYFGQSSNSTKPVKSGRPPKKFSGVLVVERRRMQCTALWVSVSIFFVFYMPACSWSGELSWTSVGPGGGGWIQAIACDPAIPNDLPGLRCRRLLYFSRWRAVLAHSERGAEQLLRRMYRGPSDG